MADKLIIFEDGRYRDFYPLTLSRPVFELRCGAGTLREKITRQFPGYEVSLACRSELAELVEARTGKKVNQIDYREGDRLVFVNGRLRLSEQLTRELKTTTDNRMYHHGKVTAAFVIAEPLQKAPPPSMQFTGEDASANLGVKADIVESEFDFYDYLWDLVDLNGKEITADYSALIDGVDLNRMIEQSRIDSSVRILSESNLYIAPGAEIGAGAVIDNRHGPVVIDKDAIIGPLSYIEGPCYIGENTRIFRGNIREGCSFGPYCRVGGEVEQSIFQEYTNKYHDGFMGHAYLGSWVNLGAMTTNSDLKNNYNNIEVCLNGEIINTGLMKVGSFIGDHSKTGIGTLINTGVSIGFSCNIFGGTLITSREVPSFSWGDETGYDVYRLDKAMEVAQVTMSRRKVEFTEYDERLFAMIFNQAGRSD